MIFIRQSIVLLVALASCIDVSAFVSRTPSSLNGKRTFITTTTTSKEKTQIAVLFSDTESETPAVEEAAPAVEIPESSADVEAAAEEDAPPADGDNKKWKERERFTVFVGNLPFTTTVNELRDLFSQKGEVIFVNLPRRKDSRQTRGFAFVDMATKEAAQNAMSLDGYDIGGRLIRVAESLPRDQAQAEPKKYDIGMKKLYVGNLPFDAEPDEIKEFFASYGDINEVYMPKNTDGSPRGFAFISVKEEDAAKCIEDTNGVDFRGRPIVVSEPLPPGKKAPKRASRDPAKTKLYVGNLSFYTVAETLAELFEEFGTVHDCYLPEDPSTGSSRGFGFVTMDAENAQAAINETDGCELDGRIIRVNEAQPRGSPKPNYNKNNDDGEFDGVDI